MESSVPLNRATESYIEMIKEVVLADLSSEDVSIALFGSMATKNVHQASDVDIAVMPRDGWNRSKMVLLREKLENSNVPYKVELVDFSCVSIGFRELALRNAIWWRR